MTCMRGRFGIKKKSNTIDCRYLITSSAYHNRYCLNISITPNGHYISEGSSYSQLRASPRFLSIGALAVVYEYHTTCKSVWNPIFGSHVLEIIALSLALEGLESELYSSRNPTSIKSRHVRRYIGTQVYTYNILHYYF